MSKLLSDVELRLKINDLTERGLFPDEVTAIIKLINSQKIAHGEMVISTETKAVYSKADTIEKAAQQIMANVKSQQRQRNSL